MGRDVGRTEHVEICLVRRLVVERDFLPVAETTRSARERRHLLGVRKQADVIGNHAYVANAGPEFFDDGPYVQRMPRVSPEIRRGVIRVVRIVGAANGGLIGQDEDVAETAELLRDRCDEIVSDQNVLVFFLVQFVARRNHDFDHVLASGEHWVAIALDLTRGVVVEADLAVRFGYCPGHGMSGDHAGELIHAVVGRGLHLIKHVHAVIALELAVVGQRDAGT